MLSPVLLNDFHELGREILRDSEGYFIAGTGKSVKQATGTLRIFEKCLKGGP